MSLAALAFQGHRMAAIASVTRGTPGRKPSANSAKLRADVLAEIERLGNAHISQLNVNAKKKDIGNALQKLKADGKIVYVGFKPLGHWRLA